MSSNAHMLVALEQARKGWGNTHPNPMVGAVIVEQDQVVATGYHKAAGKDHAEVDALRNLGRQPASDAVLYVTLEPCCTHGRTPPCTEAILDAGIRQVYIGTSDPNPKVAGQGIQQLREAGVEVHSGKLLEKQCRDLNLIYNHWISNSLSPLLAGKVATTLDGFTATRDKQSKWITSEQARQDVMRWRRLFPAIAVGAGTVLTDDPSLTARHYEEETWSPIRFVFDSLLRSWSASKTLYSDSFSHRTILVTTETAPSELVLQVEKAGIQYWKLPSQEGRPCLQAFREKCKELQISGVLFEGGSELLSSLLNQGQLDYLFAYRAPKILGDPSAQPVFQGRQISTLDEAIQLVDIHHDSLGDDQLIRGHIHNP